MQLRTLVLGAALCASALALAIDTASAADMGVMRHRHHGYRAAYVPAVVPWDDVYPPAIYGPRLRPVEEVAAMKANAAPVTSHWYPGFGWAYGGWYY